MKKYVILAACLVLAATTAAMAQTGRSAGAPYWGGTYLSQEDQAKLYEMRQKHYQATLDLRRQLYSLNSELSSVLSRPEPDRKRVFRLGEKINQLRSELFNKSLEYRFELAKEFDLEGGAGFGPGYGPGMMMGPGFGPGHGPGMMMGPGYGPGMMMGPAW